MLEESICSHLSTVAAITTYVGASSSARIYPVYLPQDPTLPAMSYQRISSQPQVSMGGFCNLDNPRIQIDCWATSYSAVKGMAEAVRDAMMSAAGFNALEISDQDLFEPDLEIYRVSIDFSCWFKST